MAKLLGAMVCLLFLGGISCVAQEITFVGVSFGADVTAVMAAAREQGITCKGKSSWGGMFFDEFLGFKRSKGREWMATICPCSGTLLDASATVELYFPFKPGKLMSGPTPGGGLEGASVLLEAGDRNPSDLLARTIGVLTEKYGLPIESVDGESPKRVWVDAVGNTVRLTTEATPEERTQAITPLGRSYVSITPARSFVRLLYLSAAWYARQQSLNEHAQSRAKGIL